MAKVSSLPKPNSPYSKTAPSLKSRILKKFSSFQPTTFTDVEVRNFVAGEFNQYDPSEGQRYFGHDGLMRETCGGGSRVLPLHEWASQY